MRKLIYIAAFLLPSTALAIPCPEGKNVPINAKTTASKVEAQQNANTSSSAGNTTKKVSLRNHYPH